MIDSSTLVDLACLTLGAISVAIGPILGARTAEPLGRMALAAATFPPLASLGLFYSLASHMHRSLGGWPRAIGDEGFPPGLVMHADFALFTFGFVALGCIFFWPIAVLLCACVPRMQSGLRYLGVYALACAAAYGAMMLAPDPFLYWWWD